MAEAAILSSEKSQIISQLEQKQDLSSISYSVNSIIANAQTTFQKLGPDNIPYSGLYGATANFKLTNTGNLASITLHVNAGIDTSVPTSPTRFTDLIESVTFKTSSSTIQSFSGHALYCLMNLDPNNVALLLNNKMRTDQAAEVRTLGEYFVSDINIPISFCTRVQSHLYLRPQENLYLVVKFRTAVGANYGTTTFENFKTNLYVESFWLDSKSQEEYNKTFLSSPYTFISFDTVTEMTPTVTTNEATHKINCTRPIFMSCISLTRVSGGGGRSTIPLFNISDTIDDTMPRNQLPVCVQNLAARRMYHLHGNGIIGNSFSNPAANPPILATYTTDNDICFVNYNINKDLDPKTFPTSALSVTQSNNPTYTLQYFTIGGDAVNYSLEVTYLVYSIVNIDPQSSVIAVSTSV